LKSSSAVSRVKAFSRQVIAIKMSLTRERGRSMYGTPDRWVNDNNPDEQLQYGNGWWDLSCGRDPTHHRSPHHQVLSVGAVAGRPRGTSAGAAAGRYSSIARALSAITSSAPASIMMSFNTSRPAPDR
jgi:hypothetical protein